jgi:uncharacterized membrane protein YraQ (UPF0718 family)
MKKQIAIFLLMAAVFAAAYLLPLSSLGITEGPFFEAPAMLQDYAHHHVLTCLIPAFFIAGGIAVFVSQASVMKYFGPAANKALAYGVASVSGSILAVCSCTVLPIFSGIHKRGAGLGPAIAFLYSGPAINVLAIILTARVLGWQFGLARAVGAVLFSVVIGFLMHLIFLKEERRRAAAGFAAPQDDGRPLWKQAAYFGAMVAILVFANWGKPGEGMEGTLYGFVYSIRYAIAAFFLVALLVMLTSWFRRDELKEWTGSTWGFAKQILSLLFAGVLVAGFLLGRPGHEALIPSRWVASLVGGNSIQANLFASIAGAFMYFATLTEVPILQGLVGAGMGKGPALALLLAGPALSLPNMLVIRSVLGVKKTLVYVSLVTVMATISGLIFGLI